MNKNAYCIGLLAFFIGVLPATAAKLVVTRSAGSQGDSIARDAQKMLEADLKGHQVIIKARPKSWAWSKGKGTLAQRIARTANTGKIELVVDCLLFKQKRNSVLVVTVVTKDAEVLYQRRKTLSRKRKTAQQQVKQLLKGTLPKVKEHLAQPAAPSPEPASAAATEPEVVAGGGELDESDSGPADAATSETSGGASAGKVDDRVEVKKKLSSDTWRFSLGLGVDFVNDSDLIDSPTAGGDIDINIPAAPGANLRILSRFKQRYIGEIQLDAYRTVTKPSEGLLAQGASPEVTAYHLGVGTLFGYAFPMAHGELEALGGFSFEKYSTSDQAIFLIPRWQRFAARVGGAASYGRWLDDTFSLRLVMLVTPWGSHSESPMTSGASSSVFGFNGDLRGRYVLWTSNGGTQAFAEAGGGFDWIKIKYSGVGTRRSLPQGQTPVEGGDETRRTLRLGVSGGLVF